MQIAIILIVGILTALYLWLSKRYLYWKSRGIPFVKPNLIFGNLKGVGSSVHSGQRIRELYEQTKSLNSFSGAYFFVEPIVIITDLELIKHILIKDFSLFHDRQVYYNEEIDPLSAHLFSLEGKKWKILRSKLSPTFTSGRMKFMFPTMIEVGNRFAQTLNDMIIKNNQSDDIEMKELFARFTTDVIGSCVFGIECNSLNDPNAAFRLVGQKMFNEPEHGEFGHMLMNSFRKTAKFFNIRSERKDVTEFFMKVLRDTIEYREKNDLRRNDFMELLIRLKNTGRIDDYDTEIYGTITFEEIAAQAYVFFGGGFETSSTTLGFCFYELVLNPDIQQRTREDIEEVLSRYDGKMTYEAVMEMEYVKRVVDETLRKYPVATILMRKTAEDYQVPDTESIIEKDITVIIPIYGLHHDPELFPDPDIFDPDRFTPEMIKQRHPCAYLPFGDGPRNCIGKRFGLMQTYIGLISILRNFKFSKCERTQIPLQYSPNTLVLTAEGGMFLKVEKI